MQRLARPRRASGLFYREEASKNHHSILIRGLTWRKGSLKAAPSAATQKRRQGPELRGGRRSGEGVLHLRESGWCNCDLLTELPDGGNLRLIHIF